MKRCRVYVTIDGGPTAHGCAAVVLGGGCLYEFHPAHSLICYGLITREVRGYVRRVCVNVSRGPAVLWPVGLADAIQKGGFHV